MVNFLNNIFANFVTKNRNSFKLVKQENGFLGIDIGTFSIKFAEISKEKNNRLYLLGLDEIMIPQNTKIGITDYEKSILLSELINKANIRNKRAIFSIENSLTSYAIVTLPNIKNKQLLDYIKLNFQDSLPVKFEDIYLEWKILEKDENNMKVLLIAINKNIIIRYQKIARNAKINFHSCETEANALANSLVKKRKGEIAVVLDVRMTNSSLSLVEKGNLLKSSSFGISINYFNENYKRAEMEKKQLEIERKIKNIVKNRKKIAKLFLETKEDLKSNKEFFDIFVKKIKKDGIKMGTAEIWEKKIKSGLERDFDFFIKELEIKEKENLEVDKNIANEIKIINKNKDFLFQEKKELMEDLKKIEKKEVKIEEELVQITRRERKELSISEKMEIVLMKKNKNIIRRKIEKKRWDIEDKNQRTETKIKEIKRELMKAIKRENVIKLKGKKIVMAKSKIKNFVEKLEQKNKEEKEIELLLKQKNRIEEEKIKYKIRDIKKPLASYFELFYNNIWLFIVGLDDNQKRGLQRIIISGGADFIFKLAEHIQQKINQKFSDVNVEIANPFININNIEAITRPIKISQFSNAIGAALKGFKKN